LTKQDVVKPSVDFETNLTKQDTVKPSFDPGEYEIVIKATGKTLQLVDGMLSTRSRTSSSLPPSRFVLKKIACTDDHGGDLELFTLTSGEQQLSFNSEDKLFRMGNEGTAPAHGVTEACCFQMRPNHDNEGSYSLVLRPHPNSNNHSISHGGGLGLASEGSCNGCELHVDGAHGGDSLLSARYQVRNWRADTSSFQPHNTAHCCFVVLLLCCFIVFLFSCFFAFTLSCFLAVCVCAVVFIVWRRLVKVCVQKASW
jgi:hypothetical protein